jgi:hypothetical protein
MIARAVSFSSASGMSGKNPQDPCVLCLCDIEDCVYVLVDAGIERLHGDRQSCSDVAIQMMREER